MLSSSIVLRLLSFARIVVSLCIHLTPSVSPVSAQAPFAPEPRVAMTRGESRSKPVTVHVDCRKPSHVFVPDYALGAAVDGYESGDIAQIYTPANVAAMRTAGFRPLAYRLRTELGDEVWHWNPRGRWSNPAAQDGYWTSSAIPAAPIEESYGYKLPRRGNSTDQANNDGYSRIDDGDPGTFWKSNPYLNPPYTVEDHPQWVMIVLGRSEPIDAIRIAWAAPYAVHFRVDYWTGDTRSLETEFDSTLAPGGSWRAFAGGCVDHGCGGMTTLRLCRRPVAAQYVRIMLLRSSCTSLSPSPDIRDRLGYAIREVYLGRFDSQSHFCDMMRHGRSTSTQSLVFVSSTDPWHRASDRDPNVEEPGFDRLFRCGLSDQAVLMPVGMAYDTPGNAVAEVEYLRSRGYRVRQVEMGEEPDGQYMEPEDYGALYVRWAAALHAANPNLDLGGPGYQTMAVPELAWSRHGEGSDKSWTHRFIRYLRAHRRLRDLQFFSSEFYFYDVVTPTAPRLRMVPRIVESAFARWGADGVPTSIPWVATEYGYSAAAAEPEVDLPGALLDADFTGRFLTSGGGAVYFYGLEPNSLIKEWPGTWGNLALWYADDNHHILAPFAAYYALCLVTHEWSQPGVSPVSVFPANVDCPDRSGLPCVTAYAAHRPDGLWSLLLINKDPVSSRSMRIAFDRGDGVAAGLDGLVDQFQYSKQQYTWHENGPSGHASPNLPPVHTQMSVDAGTVYTLPPYSLTVVRGSIQ
ncbi:MAG: discoidin domain-containing protein [Capsulimonadaceae bacterium]